MKTWKFILLLSAAALTTHVNAKVLLSEECLLFVNERIANMFIAMDGGYAPDANPSSGIDITTVKELPPVRHPVEKRLKFRLFETEGGIGGRTYRVRFILSNTRGNVCFLAGVEIMTLFPYDQKDSEIKSHNDRLYPPKKK
jgi:hypothetical protein